MLKKILSKCDLIHSLSKIDISVPKRTDRRTTVHTEVYTLCHLLSTLGASEELTYPLSISRGDRPDALLKIGHTKIGIEVTEAIPKQFAALCADAERKGVESLQAVHFAWDAPDMTPAERKKLLQLRAGTESGWAGCDPEREWAEFILHCVDTKLEKLSQPGFKKHDQNWLSIYDNLPIPTVYLEQAISNLMSFLHERWFFCPNFDTIFVEHGPVIVKITPAKTVHLLVNDLWASL